MRIHYVLHETLCCGELLKSTNNICFQFHEEKKENYKHFPVEKAPCLELSKGNSGNTPYQSS